MSSIISKIFFSDFFKKPAIDTNEYAKDLATFLFEDNDLYGLQKINFFIGENNSGKSRFIRIVMKWLRKIHLYRYTSFLPKTDISIELFAEREYNFFYDNLSENYSRLSAHKNKVIAEVSRYELDRIIEIFDKLIERFNHFPLKEIILENVEDEYNADKAAVAEMEQINPTDGDEIPWTQQEIDQEIAWRQSVIESLKARCLEHNEVIDFYKNFGKWCENAKSSIKKILYIPLLRGAKLLGENLKEDFYSKRTTKDYGFSEKEVFTGLSIYKDLQNYLLGSAKDRKLISEFEILLSMYFFDEKTVSITVNKEKDWVGLQIGEEDKERPLHDLGDGVQALILLLFPLYMRKEEEYFIFIEEPEMHLYPKWQRLFIKILQTEFPKHQFFITTHSNVFINMEGSSVYQVTRDHSSSVSHVKHVVGNDKRGILSDLGYQASDVLQANYIVWVEGISDKIYIKKFLELYDEELVEGEDYIIMFYGGCSKLQHILIDEDSQIKVDIGQINPNFGFLIDSDKMQETYSEGQKLDELEFKEKFQATCKANDKFCWLSEKRELENHIIQEVWEKAADAYISKYCPAKENNVRKSNYSFGSYADRFPKKDATINDKIKMAEQVIKIITKSDLEADTELDAAMTNLVKAIRKANEKH